MHHFAYRDGALHAEDVALPEIAREVGTPFYCYSSATIERHFRGVPRRLRRPDALVCYAMKANSNQAVLKTLARLGAGMDVVSRGRTAARARRRRAGRQDHLLRRRQDARRDGARASTRASCCFNVESEPELEALSEVARRRAARRRASPSASTRTSTRAPTPRSRPASRRTSSACRSRAPARSTPAPARLPGLAVVGVDMHIGSQITDLRPFDDAFALLADFVRTLRADGHAIDHVDLGGGLGIPYRVDNDPPPLPERYAEIVAPPHRATSTAALFSSRAG